MRSVRFPSLILLSIALLIGLLIPLTRTGAQSPVLVETFDREFINWAEPHEATFQFPPAAEQFKKVMMHLTIECPGSPGDCDPWDRLGFLNVLHSTGEVDPYGEPIIEPIEIARFITPYDITGVWGGHYGFGPGSCSWEFDVTDYHMLLRDSVTLSLYIESWIGGDDGWLITIWFEFTEGAFTKEPYKIQKLWDFDFVEYGDPNDPIEDRLAPVSVVIDEEADSAVVRVVTTGHGQGNTDNAAEFAYKWHRITASAIVDQWYLWRDDCASNPCSGQGGTWWYERAGWCPGDAVPPHDIDITPVIAPGRTVEIDYDVEPYENCCRPDNPECTGTSPCCVFGDCNNHPPNFAISAQLILYRDKAGPCAAFPLPGSGAGIRGIPSVLALMLIFFSGLLFLRRLPVGGQRG